MCWACSTLRTALGSATDAYVPIDLDDDPTVLVILGPALPDATRQLVVAAFRARLATYVHWRPRANKIGFAGFAPGEGVATFVTVPRPAVLYDVGAEPASQP